MGKDDKVKQNAGLQSKGRIKAITIATAVVMLLLLLDIFTPIWGGQVRYYAKWIECRQQPQQISGKIAWPIEYHELSPAFNIFRDNHMKYFCTSKEAEMAGYSNSSDVYDYPNLTREEYNKYLHPSEDQ